MNSSKNINMRRKISTDDQTSFLGYPNTSTKMTTNTFSDIFGTMDQSKTKVSEAEKRVSFKDD
jgi:hypothetical protein